MSSENSSGCGPQWTTRRDFLNKLLIATPLAAIFSRLLSLLRRELGLLTEAAELSKEAVIIDLHCHPNTANLRDVDPDLSVNINGRR